MPIITCSLAWSGVEWLDYSGNCNMFAPVFLSLCLCLSVSLQPYITLSCVASNLYKYLFSLHWILSAVDWLSCKEILLLVLQLAWRFYLSPLPMLRLLAFQHRLNSWYYRLYFYYHHWCYHNSSLISLGVFSFAIWSIAVLKLNAAKIVSWGFGCDEWRIVTCEQFKFICFWLIW